MKKRKKNNLLAANGIDYLPLIFCASVVILLLALIGSTRIPKEAIRPKMQESADILCEKEVFFDAIKDIKASRIDRYADSILLSIAWQLDPEHPMESAMWTSYYFQLTQNENENLRDSVYGDLPANHQYLRYWHGSAAIVRLLHLFWNIRTIYWFHGILMAALLVILLTLLLKNGRRVEAAGTTAAMILVSIWFVPWSLEYTWMFLWMLILSICASWIALKGSRKGLSVEKRLILDILFLISGIVTCYLDFLTTETLPLLIPLLLALHILEDTADFDRKKSRNFAIRSCVIWGAGYIGMWLMKWLLASLILHENAMQYVWGHVEERIGAGQNIPLPQFLAGALWKNICCLFPLGYGTLGVEAAVVLTVLLAYICFVYHRKTIDRDRILLYAALGCIPLIRYLIIHNHSYLHYFFTYRAQAAGILALSYILWEITDFGAIRRKKRR